MVELEREDIYAALLLSWLKYTPVTEEDVKSMKNIDLLVKNKEYKNLEKSKRKLLRIKKNENQETPEVEFPKKVRNLPSGLVNFSRKSYGSSSFDDGRKNPETPGVELSKKVRNLPYGLMDFSRKSYGSTSFDGEELLLSKNPETPETQFPQKVRNSTSGLMNFSRKSYGSSSFDGGEELLLLPRRKGKNPETPEVQLSKKLRNSPFSETYEAFDARNFNPIPKRVRVSSSTMMNLQKKSSGFSSINGENSNPIAKRVRVSPKKPSGLVPKFPPIETLRALIGQCSNPIVKKLTKSDVDEHQGRLLLNNEDVRRKLLPLLNEKHEDLVDGIKVKTYDPSGNFHKMTFKTWGNNKSYVLVGSWKQFVQENNLMENDCVTVWMFRHSQTGGLCFAIIWMKTDPEAFRSGEAARVAVVGTDPETFRSGEDGEARVAVVGADPKAFRSGEDEGAGVVVVGADPKAFRSGEGEEARVVVVGMDPEAFMSEDGEARVVVGMDPEAFRSEDGEARVVVGMDPEAFRSGDGEARVVVGMDSEAFRSGEDGEARVVVGMDPEAFRSGEDGEARVSGWYGSRGIQE